MSALAAVTPAPTVPFPVVLLPDTPPAKRDVVSGTVLRYLELGRKIAAGKASANDRVEHSDCLDHLVAICYRAVQPYFLRDRHGSLTVAGIPQFNGVDGRRTAYFTRREGTADAATSAWIQEWLLKFLTPYRRKSEGELIAAADSGEFRYLGRLCHLRLKDIVCRQLNREAKEDFQGFVRIDPPVGNAGLMGDYIGTNHGGGQSSLGQRVSFEEVLLGVGNARRIVLANVDEFSRLDLLSGLVAYLDTAEHIMEPHFEGRVTRAIARMRGISSSAARAYKRKYGEAMERELRARNPVLQSIAKELIHEPTRPFVVSTGSAEENMRLIREARQLFAEYANDCRAQGLRKSALDVEKEYRRLSWQQELMRRRLCQEQDG